MKLQIQTQPRQSVSIIKTIGELDASNAVMVDDEINKILELKPGQLWIDATELNYVSSAGLGVFLSHLHTFKMQNINLVFFGLNKKIASVFNILGLDAIMTIVPTLDDAIKAYGEPDAKMPEARV